jgi:methionyl-tRNA synthetase
MNKILITSALPYANGYLHLGHLAGAYLPADIFARYSRLSGKEVLYVCGSDEHGVAITISAEKEKTTPQEIIDKYHFANWEAFQKFGMSFDIYSRTSIPEHHKIAKEFFVDFYKKGLLAENEEEQFFDEKVNMFLPDRYVEGICPNCGSDKARGDQCDSCGAYYNQIELINPKSIVSGDTPVVRKTTHWYFKFQDLQQFLEDYINSHEVDWKDNVLRQTYSWLKMGLTERAITRDLAWGVSIEDIPELDKAKTIGKVLYVWFDAVLGYISATKVWARENLGSEDAYSDWWKNDKTDYYAFIGKDNIVFHTLIFPALLHSKGENYLLPKNVPANEFLNLEGQKFSKSNNWGIDLRDFQSDFPEESSNDALRYALLMNLPETRDADFTWKDYQTRNNSELGAIFGNFVNRTSQFIAKNFDSKVPEVNEDFISYWKNKIEFLDNNYAEIPDKAHLGEDFDNILNENDKIVITALWQGIEKSKINFSKFKVREAYLEIMNIARASNKYFNDEAPWKSIKENKELASKTLYVCAQLIGSLSVLFAPALPNAARKLQTLLEIPLEIGSSNNANPIENHWEKVKNPTLPVGGKFDIKDILFPNIEDEVIEKQVAKLGANNEKPAQQSAEVFDLISIDDFRKVKLRTAKVLEAEKVPKSDKLLKLQIQIGDEKRQLIAGIAQHYTPEQMVGKVIIVVANLQPAKLFGNLSQGMLLAAKSPDGKLSLITVEESGFPSGADVS